MCASIHLSFRCNILFCLSIVKTGFPVEERTIDVGGGGLGVTREHLPNGVRGGRSRIGAREEDSQRGPRLARVPREFKERTPRTDPSLACISCREIVPRRDPRRLTLAVSGCEMPRRSTGAGISPLRSWSGWRCRFWELPPDSPPRHNRDNIFSADMMRHWPACPFLSGAYWVQYVPGTPYLHSPAMPAMPAMPAIPRTLQRRFHPMHPIPCLAPPPLALSTGLIS